MKMLNSSNSADMGYLMEAVKRMVRFASVTGSAVQVYENVETYLNTIKMGQTVQGWRDLLVQHHIKPSTGYTCDISFFVSYRGRERKISISC